MQANRLIFSIAALLLLAGCGSQRTQEQATRSPAQVQAEIVRLLPAKAADPKGWARDIQVAFTAQDISPTTQNLCSVLAVTEQESTFQVDPSVPGLGKIAREEIDRRAASAHIPGLLVSGALKLDSPNGKSYSDRLNAARSEKELSAIFDDFIGMASMGKTLFGGFNPVHTGGPMQVSIAYAEQHAKARPYPYPVEGSIRHEVFTRRGGMYFGIAHLLDYPAPYDSALYRFADFNAGHYASRNAAFQNAVSLASGIPLDLDGDLLRHGDDADERPGATELAVRTMSGTLGLSGAEIRRQLAQGEADGFERSTLYRRVFERADTLERKPLPRALLPRIVLKSPKITRRLTTEWFAGRVDARHRRCLERGAGSPLAQRLNWPAAPAAAP